MSFQSEKTMYRSNKKTKKNHGKLDEVEGEEDASFGMCEDGQRMTAFNLNEENEDGYFDGSGNFVWSSEGKEVQEDGWLHGVSKDQMRAAAKAKDLALREEQEDKSDGTDMTVEESINVIISILHEKETVLEALKRLGKNLKRRRQQNDHPESKETDTSELHQKQFDLLTDAADRNMRAGRATKASLMNTFEDETKKEQSINWEYKGGDGVIYGPFSTECFIDWTEKGFFRGESSVQIRQIENPHNMQSEENWINSDTVDFTMYL